MRRRTLLLFAALPVLAIGGAGVGAQTADDEHVACVTVAVTASTPAHEVGVDGSPVHVIPGDTQTATDSACVTATDRTVTEHDTQTVTVTAPTTTAPPTTTTEPPATPDIDRTTQWLCNGTVDLDWVRVTITAGDVDAVRWDDCSGRIGRLDVYNLVPGGGDGVKGRNGSGGQPHDLVVESGLVVCGGPHGDHRDAVSIMGGRDVTFRDFVTDCGRLSDPFGAGVVSEWSPSQGGSNVTIPTRIVCDHCVFMAGASNTVIADRSNSSGARNSIVCPDRTPPNRWLVDGTTVGLVNVGNLEPPATDARCTDRAAALAWANG